MPIRRPTDNSVETLQRLVADLDSELRQLRDANANLSGRRLGNAGDALDPADLVTLRQLSASEDRVKKLLKARQKIILSRPPATVPAGQLPAPNHHIDFSYYFTDRPSYGDPVWGEFYDEVKGYTNNYTPDSYFPSDVPASEVRRLMGQYLLRAARDGKSLDLSAGVSYGEQYLRDFLEAVIEAGTNEIWPKLVRGNIDDESFNSASEAEESIARCMEIIREYNLTDPPLGYGFTLTQDQVLNTTAPQAANASFISIEAYVDPPGSNVSQENIDRMVSFIRQAKAVIPNSKKITIVLQGYARNGDPGAGTYNWPNFATLADLQIPVYMESYLDQRVTQLKIFSYCRYSGTRDVDQHGGKLAEKHKLIGAAILSFSGQTQQVGCSQLATGGLLNETYLLAIDQTIINNLALIEIINGVSYVLAGSEASFMAAMVAQVNGGGYGLECILHPAEPATIVSMKQAASGTYSEDYACLTSDRRVRYAGAYRQTCYPAQF